MVAFHEAVLLFAYRERMRSAWSEFELHWKGKEIPDHDRFVIFFSRDTADTLVLGFSANWLILYE